MESWEIEISALLDGELEPERVLPLLDALARDAGLRRFYQRARSLDAALLAGNLGPEAAPASPRLWDRIRAGMEAGTSSPAWWKGGWRGGTGLPRMVRVPAWTLGAAAAVFVVLLAWRAAPDLSTRLRIGPGAAAESGGLIEVGLGSRPEAMNDRRFVELTAQLLEADPRYRRKMLQVMEEVRDAGFIAEGSNESGRRTEGEGPSGRTTSETP
jgi:hypothetical protein